MNFYLRWVSSTFFGLVTNKPYCSEWNKKLNRLLDLYGDQAKVGRHTVKLGRHEVWISNEYYAYGHLYGSQLPEMRPGVRTMRRLDAIVQKARREREHSQRRDYVNRVRGLEE